MKDSTPSTYCSYISMSLYVNNPTGLHEFDSLKNPEVNDFRWKMRLLGDEIARERQNKTWLEKMHYQFPPRLAATPVLSPVISSRLRDGRFVLVTKFENTEVQYHY